MSETTRALARFFGAILIAVGGLIALLSGACTLIVAGASLAGGADGTSTIPLALLFGAPVFAAGAGLFFWGCALISGPKPSTPRIQDGLDGLDGP